MATTGTLKLQADGTYKGEFHSLKHQFPLQMIPNGNIRSDKSPTYLIFSGRTRLGAAWENEAETTGTVYYTVALKDPEFGTLYLRLFQGQPRWWHLQHRFRLNLHTGALVEHGGFCHKN